jgi:hypothetical protein
MNYKSAILVSLLFLFSCTSYITNFNNVVDLEDVDLKKIESYKKGETCRYSYLGLGPFGSASILETAKKGDIGKVVFIDTKSTWYPGYIVTCLVVYGL